MLLDSTHKKWCVVTAVLAAAAIILHAVLAARTPGGLTGGSTAGLWYGVAGSALMVYAGLLSALRRVPSWWWIGSRQTWMRGHIWLGLLGGLLILCHSGYHWGGPLEIACWVVLIAILATGVYGLALQQFLPRLLARRVPFEASYEQLPHLYDMLRGRAEELVEAAELWPAGPADEKGRSELRRFHDETLRPFLRNGDRHSPLAGDAGTEAAFGRLRARMGLSEKVVVAPAAEAAYKKVRDALLAPAEVEEPAAKAKKVFAELDSLPDAAAAGPELRKACQARWVGDLEAVCRERRAYAGQERLHHWLHGWLLLHVPLSLALLVLGTLHAILSLYY